MAVALTTKLSESITEEVADIIQSLPDDYIVSRFNELQILSEEYDLLQATLTQKGGFLGLGRKMPKSQIETYENRIRSLRVQLEGLLRVIKAIHSGYQPYTIPNNWYAGYVEVMPEGNLIQGTVSRHGIDQNNRLDSQFSAPMPASVIEKYEIAKRQKLFDVFLVAAPDQSLFKTVQSIFSEPAVVGYVATRDRHVKFGQSNGEGLQIQYGIGFLIDMWDLRKDREAAGLNF